MAQVVAAPGGAVRRAALLSGIVAALWCAALFATDGSAPANPGLADLARRGPSMLAAQDALRGGNAERAVELLSSFDFGGREIEEYRLYFLANAYELQRRSAHARKTLARLWARSPRMIYRNDAGIHLGDLYLRGCYWNEVALLHEGLAAGPCESDVAALAKWNALGARLALGDPGAVLSLATAIATDAPRAAEGDDALAIVAALRGSTTTPAGGLTLDQKIRRAEALTRSGDAARALAELDSIRDPAGSYVVRGRMILARAVALQKSAKLAESEALLKPLFSGPDEIAIPALYNSWKNSRALEQTLRSASWRTIMVRENAGTRRVKIKGKWVERPMYRKVQKRVQVLDARTKAKIDGARAGAVRSLKSLLALPVDAAVRKEALREIASLAMEKKTQTSLEEAIEALVRVDPDTDLALQYLWDQGWSAWHRSDLATARERFAFIYRTYRGTSVRRKARYWYARCLERTGEPEEAKRHYQELVDVPYEDVYVIFARSRGAKPTAGLKWPNPFTMPDNWDELADRDMPEELRLAWELSRAGLMRDARAEIREKQSDANRSWAFGILAELYQSEGSPLLVSHSLRRGFPELGTVAQDRVPPRFLRMYYPLAYRELLERRAKERGLDADLVKGLVLQESGYEKDAGSGVGAVGLMQLMPATARETSRKVGRPWNRARLTDPEYNLDLGTYYLRSLFDMMRGNEILALAAYNAGFGNVQHWMRAERNRRRRVARRHSLL